MAHKTEGEIHAAFEEAGTRVAVGGRYVHFKNPQNEYEVLGFGILTDTDDVAVLYKALYYENPVTFIRALSSFTEEVEWEGKQVLRFTKVS